MAVSQSRRGDHRHVIGRGNQHQPRTVAGDYVDMLRAYAANRGIPFIEHEYAYAALRCLGGGGRIDQQGDGNGGDEQG